MSKPEWRNRYNFPAEQGLIRLVESNPGMYGSMMSIISQMWREKDPVGAFTVGPCYRQVEMDGNYFEVVDERDQLRKELESAWKTIRHYGMALMAAKHLSQEIDWGPIDSLTVSQEGEGASEGN